jgi:uncharacterized protein
MTSRREFVGRMGLLAGAGLVPPGLLDRLALGNAALRPADPTLWAVDAGEVRVSPGPWTFLPETAAGVHLENLYLRMPDGVRLNAFLYLPASVERGTEVPGVLNTTPYRYGPSSDSHFARHGYASIFVDVRGSGGSEGFPEDEYTEAEYEDILHIIDWLSKQPWSNGNIGMYGSSYSAINSLWVAAALRPPALKATFLMAGTDIRYTDDIHHPGGSMLMVDNSWALMMINSLAMPGAPDYDLHSQASMDRWNTPPWIQGFLHNQTDGDYYRRGSLAPDYERLTLPTFLAGGYLDMYQNFVPRIMRYSRGAVTKGIMGTWHHGMSVPGPVLDWNAIRVRWFDHWLKGRDTGMMDEPRLSFYMPSWRRQSFRYTEDIPGEWRHLDAWPDTAYEPPERLYFRPEPELSVARARAMDPAPGAGGFLSDVPGPASALKLDYRPGTGGRRHSLGPATSEGFYGLDYREEDVWGLSFDTPPLADPVEILGFTRARLFVSSTAPVGNWIVRLCDVAPDGTSYLLHRGFLNGTHRHSHSHPEPMIPGEVHELEIQLFCVGYRFEPGHRIRIVVTNADFPVIWPSSHPMTTTLFTGGDHASHVALPVLPVSPGYRSGDDPPHASPEEEARRRTPRSAPEGLPWLEVTEDLENGGHTAVSNLPGVRLRCQVRDDDPATASMMVSGTRRERDERDGRVVEVHAEGGLRSTESHFILDIEATLRENGREIRSRRWKDEIRRRLV